MSKLNVFLSRGWLTKFLVTMWANSTIVVPFLLFPLIQVISIFCKKLKPILFAKFAIIMERDMIQFMMKEVFLAVGTVQRNASKLYDVASIKKRFIPAEVFAASDNN